MRRREFLKASAGVVGASSVLTAVEHALAAAPAPAPATTAPVSPVSFRTAPYLQDPTTDGMTVMWMTTGPACGHVEYGESDSLGKRADPAPVDGLVAANGTLHRVRITGLSPGKRYFYRVVARGMHWPRPGKVDIGDPVTSPVQSFRTPDPAARSLRFVIYNDLHENVPLWRALSSRVAREQADADFVFLNGDVTNNMPHEQRMVGEFLTPASQLFAGSVPMLYARGNHETRGAYARQMKDYLSLPHDRYYYAFTRGPARIVVLDSGEDKEDNHVEYDGLAAFDPYREAQERWLAAEIASPAWRDAKYRIALWHIPPMYSGDRHGTTHVKQLWGPLMNEGKADLYVGGHTHKYRVEKANPAAGHNYPIVIGGAPRFGAATVTVVEADDQGLRVKMIRDDGTLVGEVG